MPVRQAGQAVIDGVVQQPLARGTLAGHVLHGADDARHLSVAGQHGPYPQAEGAVRAVLGEHAQIEADLAAPHFDQRVERGTEPILILGMDAFEPDLDRPAQTGRRHAKTQRQFLRDLHTVAVGVPVEDEIAAAGQGQRPAFDFAQGTDRHLAFGKGVLNRGEPDQHDDQHQAAGDGRLGDIIGDAAGNDQPGIEQPGDEDDPGRHQEHRTVIPPQGQKDDDEEAEEAERHQHDAGDGRRDLGLDEGKGEQAEEHRHQRQRQMHETHMPAVQVQIDEQEAEQRRGQRRLRSGAIRLDRAVSDPEQSPEHPEIDKQIDKDRPGDACRDRKHDPAP